MTDETPGKGAVERSDELGACDSVFVNVWQRFLYRFADVILLVQKMEFVKHGNTDCIDTSNIDLRRLDSRRWHLVQPKTV